MEYNLSPQVYIKQNSLNGDCKIPISAFDYSDIF